MPQSPSLLPWRTTLQNVLLGQELQGKKNTEEAIKMIEKAGLSDYIHSYPSELIWGDEAKSILYSCFAKSSTSDLSR